MRIVVAIDDTDNLDSRGTGEIASLIADAVVAKGWGTAGFVTRHQLLVHPDIPYTSHNSAMCFLAEIGAAHLDELISFAGRFLDEECAEGSDPGLCVAVLDRIDDLAELVQFGRRAKLDVLQMAEALELAARLGLHLSPHGGTGQGVIGALAGVGLRLHGSDGRMKGSLKFRAEELSVAEILRHPHVDSVCSRDGRSLAPAELVAIGEKPKAVLLGGLSVLLVGAAPGSSESAARWQTLSRKELRGY